MILGAVKTCAHPPDVCAGKFSGCLHCRQHSISVGQSLAGINSHDSARLTDIDGFMRTEIEIEQILRISAARSEDLVLGKYRLCRQSICFGNKDIATIKADGHALQNDSVEGFGVHDNCVPRHLKRQVVWLKSRDSVASDFRVAADRCVNRRSTTTLSVRAS